MVLCPEREDDHPPLGTSVDWGIMPGTPRETISNRTIIMSVNEESLVTRVALSHSISQDAVRTVLRALRSGGGRMAQFSHPEFGGMSQWSPGMTMVGDMFNTKLKSKLDAVCSELAEFAAKSGEGDARGADENGGVSYRAAPKSDWWPAGLGTPTSVGAQNDLRYAIFPRRLVIKAEITCGEDTSDCMACFVHGHNKIQPPSFTQGLGCAAVVSVHD
jgi:hypothetical protein